MLDIENHHNTHPTTNLYSKETGTNHSFNDNNLLQKINKPTLKSYCEVLQHQKNNPVFLILINHRFRRKKNSWIVLYNHDI